MLIWQYGEAIARRPVREIQRTMVTELSFIGQHILAAWLFQWPGVIYVFISAINVSKYEIMIKNNYYFSINKDASIIKGSLLEDCFVDVFGNLGMKITRSGERLYSVNRWCVTFFSLRRCSYASMVRAISRRLVCETQHTKITERKKNSLGETE